jgi:hypothetical protein
MKKYAKYYLLWKLHAIVGFPEYTYSWWRSAYKISKADCIIEKETKRIEDKFKRLYLYLNLDYNEYLSLKKIKEDFIIKTANSIRNKYFPI